MRNYQSNSFRPKKINEKLKNNSKHSCSVSKLRQLRKSVRKRKPLPQPQLLLHRKRSRKRKKLGGRLKRTKRLLGRGKNWRR
jgi:hypothetical protein